MKVVAFIFARGGSKGLIGKNIKKLLGKPLIAYSIDMAKQIKEVSDIFVSTDDKKIKEISLEFGAKVIDRPNYLAKDKTPEWLAWEHAIKHIRERGLFFDTFLSLPATSPLRSKSDVQLMLQGLSRNVDIVISMTEANRNPWFNMVKAVKEKDQVVLVNKGEDYIYNRQEAPKVFDMTTVAYVSRPDFILTHNGIFEGKVKGVKISSERAVDIDTELDFYFAEFLMLRNKLNAE